MSSWNFSSISDSKRPPFSAISSGEYVSNDFFEKTTEEVLFFNNKKTSKSITSLESHFFVKEGRKLCKKQKMKKNQKNIKKYSKKNNGKNHIK